MKSKHFLSLAILLMATFSFTSCRTTLYRAVESNDIHAVREELKTGADPDGKPSRAQLIWQVPAIVAAIPVDVAQVGLTIGTLGVYAEVVMKPQEEPFLLSKIEKFIHERPIQITEDTEIITELLLAGARGSDWDKCKSVSEAARRGDAATLRKLLEKSCLNKADWNCKGEPKPLMLAIAGGHEECARILLEHGAQFFSRAVIDNKEVSCYDYAVAKGQLDMFKRLGGMIYTAPNSLAGMTLTLDASEGTGYYDNSCSAQYVKDYFADVWVHPYLLDYPESAIYKKPKKFPRLDTLEMNRQESDWEFYKMKFTSGNAGQLLIGTIHVDTNELSYRKISNDTIEIKCVADEDRSITIRLKFLPDGKLEAQLACRRGGGVGGWYIENMKVTLK